MKETAKLGYDVIIVGAGPAGLCAAMYAGRGMLKALTIERGAPGGELLNTDLIEDYIGFESIKGWELAQKMAEHAKKFGAEIVTDTVEQIRKADDGWFDVATARGKTYRAPAVILTAGGTPVKLGVPGEKEYAGKGVSYCAVCDGAFFKGEVLAVVGGGDAAVEEADYLTRYASKVYIVQRRPAPRVQDHPGARVCERQDRNDLEQAGGRDQGDRARYPSPRARGHWDGRALESPGGRSVHFHRVQAQYGPRRGTLQTRRGRLLHHR